MLAPRLTPPVDNNSIHPLLTVHPLQLVPPMEYGVLNPESSWFQDTFLNTPPPRLYCTHFPYNALPDSITSSTSTYKIIYMYRNALDHIVSLWHFLPHGEEETIEGSSSSMRKLENIIDSFCKGMDAFGPHWDHVLGYWKDSLERPQKVMFIRYEDMKSDQISGIKKLADFIGYPFTAKEVEDGMVERIAQLCSLESLKGAEVNKSENNFTPYKELNNSKFFRKGEVGDWVNHLSPTMVDRVEKVMREKFHGTGFQP